MEKSPFTFQRIKVSMYVKTKCENVKSIQLPGLSGEDPFRLLANCFLFYCRDLAVFIFTMILDNLRPDKKTGHSVHPMGRITYCQCPFYSFNFIEKKYLL